MLITLLLMVILSESFVDSLQNGMNASITTIYLAIKEEVRRKEKGYERIGTYLWFKIKIINNCCIII